MNIDIDVLVDDCPNGLVCVQVFDWLTRETLESYEFANMFRAVERARVLASEYDCALLINGNIEE